MRLGLACLPSMETVFFTPTLLSPDGAALARTESSEDPSSSIALLTSLALIWWSRISASGLIQDRPFSMSAITLTEREHALPPEKPQQRTLAHKPSPPRVITQFRLCQASSQLASV